MEALFTRKSPAVKKSIPKFKFGIPSFDKFLSGGLYQGTVTLLSEDSESKHHFSFTRCFLGEGAQSKDQIFIYSAMHTQNLIPPVGRMPKEPNAKMRIAWRYTKQVSEIESSVYDLSKSCNYPYKISNPDPECLYSKIYEDVSESLDGVNDCKSRRIFVRINLEDWECKQLNTFLLSLRCLIRSLNAVCLVSVNYSFGNERKILVCEHNADFVIGIKDFEGENPFLGFCAMLEIKKNVKLHDLASYDLPSYVLGVVRDNKFLSVENLSLPPADSMNSSKALDY